MTRTKTKAGTPRKVFPEVEVGDGQPGRKGEWLEEAFHLFWKLLIRVSTFTDRLNRRLSAPCSLQACSRLYSSTQSQAGSSFPF